MIRTDSHLWMYLTGDMQLLLRDGEFLVDDSLRHPDAPPTDFSYLVFPFAKLFEGFLKKVFLEASIIDRRDYQSNHFRIGKILSPNLVRRLGEKSAYKQISDRYGNELAARLWHTWREGRNLVFHYYPDQVRTLSRSQAIEIIETITGTMSETLAIFKLTG